MIRPNLRMGVGQLASLGDTQGNKIRGDEGVRGRQKEREGGDEKECVIGRVRRSRDITEQREKDYCMWQRDKERERETDRQTDGKGGWRRERMCYSGSEKKQRKNKAKRKRLLWLTEKQIKTERETDRQAERKRERRRERMCYRGSERKHRNSKEKKTIVCDRETKREEEKKCTCIESDG
jgi:hypothetical protein